MVFQPVNKMEREVAVIIPTHEGGTIYMMFHLHDAELRVVWAASGRLFRAYKYKPNQQVWDFCLSVLEDMDKTEPTVRDKIVRFLFKEKMVEETHWLKPMKTIFDETTTAKPKNKQAQPKKKQAQPKKKEAQPKKKQAQPKKTVASKAVRKKPSMEV